MTVHAAVWMWIQLCIAVFVAAVLWDIKRELARAVELLETMGPSDERDGAGTTADE